jgi:hypothetical protein
MLPPARLLHFDRLHAIKARWRTTERSLSTYQENGHRLAGYVGYSEKGLGTAIYASAIGVIDGVMT